MLIVVEGCLGAGKTTVARGLSSARGSELLLEDFESNPFLQAFYDDPKSNTFETEFAFLLLHFHQLKSQAPTIRESEVVSDFHLWKDRLYAELNLGEHGLKSLFTGLFDYCAERTPTPDLMVCLSVSNDLLLDRIRQRNREFEVSVDAGYYVSVNAAYEEAFKAYKGKKISINMDDWNFVTTPALYSKLNALVQAKVAQ